MATILATNIRCSCWNEKKETIAQEFHGTIRAEFLIKSGNLFVYTIHRAVEIFSWTESQRVRERVRKRAIKKTKDRKEVKAVMAATAHQNTRAPITKPQQQKTAKMHLHFDCIKMKSINLTSGYALTPKQGLNPGRVEDFNVDIKF